MNPINRSVYAYRGGVCIHQLLGQKMAAPLEKSCSSWIRNKKRDWIVIIITIKRFSRYGEPVVYPPVQCMENSQNCCVAPCWEAATSVVFMMEELRGGGSAVLRCRQTGFGGTKGVPPFLSWCWRGLGLLQLRAVPLQACSRWSSGNDINGIIPQPQQWHQCWTCSWSAVTLHGSVAAASLLSDLAVSSPQPVIFWGSGSVPVLVLSCHSAP